MDNELALELALKMQSLFGDSIQFKDYLDGANIIMAELKSKGFRQVKEAKIPETHFRSAVESNTKGCFLYENELNKLNPNGLWTEVK